MVCPSWHVPYAMKPWLSYANMGFDGGFNTKLRCCVWNYMHEGKYFNDGGGQGGGVNAPWDGGKSNPMLGLSWFGNHLSLLWVVSLYISLVSLRCGGNRLIVHIWRYALYLGLQCLYCCCFEWRFCILLKGLCLFFQVIELPFTVHGCLKGLQ